MPNMNPKPKTVEDKKKFRFIQINTEFKEFLLISMNVVWTFFSYKRQKWLTWFQPKTCAHRTADL